MYVIICSILDHCKNKKGLTLCCRAIVVPVLFQHSLKEPEDESVANLDHIFGVEPLKISSPSTDAEVSIALRVLEGCCLLHSESTALSHQYKAIQVLELSHD